MIAGHIWTSYSILTRKSHLLEPTDYFFFVESLEEPPRMCYFLFLSLSSSLFLFVIRAE
jgi:hypothetical protein